MKYFSFPARFKLYPLSQALSRFKRGLGSPSNPPGCDQVQQVLPALADFAEFVLNLSRLAVLAGPGQTLTHHLQLLLVFLGDADLLLVVLI